MNRSLLVLILVGICSELVAVPTPLKRVRALLIADTNAVNLRETSRANVEAMEKTLKDIFDNPRYPNLKGRLTIDYLGYDGKLTAADIRDYYRNNYIGVDETLLFFYAGHGGWDLDEGHYLAMSGGKLVRKDLHALLDQTNAGFQIVLTNACSNFAELPVAPTYVEKYYQDSTSYEKFYENLFFQHRGRTDLTATQKGEYAWGSFFTLGLGLALGAPEDMKDSDGDGFLHWVELLPQIQIHTNNVFKERRERSAPDADIKKSFRQVPHAFALGTVASASIKGMYLEINAVSNGQKGIRINFDMETRGWKGHELQVNAYFYNSKGEFLMDKDGSHRSSTGRVMIGTKFVVQSDWLKRGEGSYFIPYSQLDVPIEQLRREPHSIQLQIWHGGTYINGSLNHAFGGKG